MFHGNGIGTVFMFWERKSPRMAKNRSHPSSKLQTVPTIVPKHPEESASSLGKFMKSEIPYIILIFIVLRAQNSSIFCKIESHRKGENKPLFIAM